jgi:hypothetical protein
MCKSKEKEMKKLLIISFLLASTSAFAGSNILSLSPGVTTNNVMFGDTIAMQVEKAHPTVGKHIKGKPTNKLEATDEFPTDDVLIDDNGDVVVITVDPREWKGIEEGGWVPELEPKCACIGIDHIPFDELQQELPQE